MIQEYGCTMQPALKKNGIRTESEQEYKKCKEKKERKKGTGKVKQVNKKIYFKLISLNLNWSGS